MLHLHLKRICWRRQPRAGNVSQLGWWWGGGVCVLPHFPHLLYQLLVQSWENLHLLLSLFPYFVLLPLPTLYLRLTLTHRTTGLNSSRQESLALRCRDWAADCKAGRSSMSYFLDLRWTSLSLGAFSTLKSTFSDTFLATPFDLIWLPLIALSLIFLFLSFCVFFFVSFI